MSANIWPFFAIAALGGAAYFAATREEKPRRKPATDSPNGPGPDGGEEDPLGPGGISGGAQRQPPPEPTGGWDVYLTPRTAAEALESVKREASATTGEEAVRKSLERVFDVAWIEPLAVWQKRARSMMWSTLQDLSEWKDWTENYGAPNDMPYIWWLQAEASVTFCKYNQGLSDNQQIRLCAARIMFPDQQWPPGGSAAQWQRQVWTRLSYIIT